MLYVQFGFGSYVFVWANLYNFLQFHHHDFSRDLVEKTTQMLREYENIVFSLCFCMGLSVYCEYMHLICCSIEHQRLTALTALWPSLESDQTHSVSVTLTVCPHCLKTFHRLSESTEPLSIQKQSLFLCFLKKCLNILKFRQYSLKTNHITLLTQICKFILF